MARIEERLAAAVAAYDTLNHPYYRAWSMGELTLADLRAYAGEYQLQIAELPALLRSAAEGAADPETRAAIVRNLDEEEGRAAPEGGRAVAHRELWLRFAEALGARRDEFINMKPSAATEAAAADLRACVSAGSAEALGALWAYEQQTARVATSKREGLSAHYGIEGVEFFALHEALDRHHAADLLSALSRAAGRDPAAIDRACAAATLSARAQWRFLDGVQEARS